jgi:hypothetical protein
MPKPHPWRFVLFRFRNGILGFSPTHRGRTIELLYEVQESIMNPSFYIKVFLPCLVGVTAIFFFIVGLRGIVSRKPFLFSARWLFVLLLLNFVPSILQPFLFLMRRVGHESGMLTNVLWLNPIMFTVITIFMWFTLRGYLAFAVTDLSFREGLLASLKKLELPYEEKLAALHLPSIGADLQVAVQSWIGTGQLKMKQRKFNGLLGDIVKGMNEYYQSSTVSVNLTTCIFYVLMGVFMAVFAGVVSIGFGKLP